MSLKYNYTNTVMLCVFLLAVSFVQFGCATSGATYKQSHETKKLKLQQSDSNGSAIYSFQDDLKVGVRGPEMVIVPKGQFVMGDQQGSGAPDEQPVHSVKLDQDFAIGKFEVTVEQFRNFAESTGYVTSAEKGMGCYTYTTENANNWKWLEGGDWVNPSFDQASNHPVVCVSWDDAVAYTRWLSQQTGQQYRLPTEAEWEYVARAGSVTDFWWGSDNEKKCTQANCCLSQTWLKKQTLPVGTFTANHFGVHDTAGNVWEWTASNYSARYNGEELNAADRGQYDSMRVSRGGSWFNFSVDTRSAKRSRNWPQERFSTTGFRVVRVVTPEFVKVALANHGLKQ